jgi:hypothetical protein
MAVVQLHSVVKMITNREQSRIYKGEIVIWRYLPDISLQGRGKSWRFHFVGPYLSLSCYFLYLMAEYRPTNQHLCLRLLQSMLLPRNKTPNFMLLLSTKCQLLRIEGVAWSGQRIPTVVNLDFLDPDPLFFHSSSSSVILTRLSEPRSRLTTSQKIR